MVKREPGGVAFFRYYLFTVRQQFEELRELLCSITVSSALPDVFNDLLSRPAKKNPHISGMTSLLKRNRVKNQLPPPAPPPPPPPRRKKPVYEQYQLLFSPRRFGPRRSNQRRRRRGRPDRRHAGDRGWHIHWANKKQTCWEKASGMSR